MPALTSDTDICVCVSPVVAIIPADFHVIKAVSFQAVQSDVPPNAVFAQIGILSGGEDYLNVIAILAQDYCGYLNSISWTGSIPVESDTYIFAAALGSSSAHFRLSTILWKIVSDEKGRFLADP